MARDLASLRGQVHAMTKSGARKNEPPPSASPSSIQQSTPNLYPHQPFSSGSPRRSRFKKFCKQRAKSRGVTSVLGPHWGFSSISQCLRCDRGQHRRCDRLPHCTARTQSPRGVNKEKIGAPAPARADSRCARLPPVCGPVMARPWRGRCPKENLSVRRRDLPHRPARRVPRELSGGSCRWWRRSRSRCVSFGPRPVG